MPHAAGEGSGHPQRGRYAPPRYTPRQVRRFVRRARPAPNVGGYRHGRYALGHARRPRGPTAPVNTSYTRRRKAQARRRFAAGRRERDRALLQAFTAGLHHSNPAHSIEDFMNNANHLAPYGRTEDFQPRIGSELEHRLRAVSLGPAPDKKTKQAFRQRSFALRAMRPRLHGRIGYKLQD